MSFFQFSFLSLFFLISSSFSLIAFGQSSGSFSVNYESVLSHDNQYDSTHQYIFNAYPEEGFSFSHWKINGELISQNPYIIDISYTTNGIWDEGEEFIDALNGEYDEGETFVDANGNGVYDAAELFTDTLNGTYDIGEEFTDALNGEWDDGEEFTDLNNNGVWDQGMNDYYKTVSMWHDMTDI